MGEGGQNIHARIAEVKRRADLAGVIGRSVRLRKAGRELEGLCPFHQEKSPSFTVVPEKGFFHCFGCGANGDVLTFVQQDRGLTLASALRELEAECGIEPGAAPSPANRGAQRPSLRREVDDGLVTSIEAGIQIWRSGQRARGELVEAYLRGRAIDVDASGILDVVRFHPRCPVSRWKRWERHADARLTAPAMLSPICRVALQDSGGGAPARAFVQQGVHITFLAPDGKGKAKLPPWQDRQGEWHKRPSRKIWGEAGLGCVPVPPAGWAEFRDGDWIDMVLSVRSDERGPLVIGEGLESTLSLLARTPAARGALATLSLNNLQGYWLEDGPKLDGRAAMPLWNMRADPERPAFTVPDAGLVVIGIDADMAGLKNRVVQLRPKEAPLRLTLTGAQRSEICGQVAAAHWRLAGARPVRVSRPAMGRDFNDMAMEAAR